MFYIEPTHMEQQRSKQGARLVAEEFLVNIGQVFSVVGHGLCNVVDSAYIFAGKTRYFAQNNKETVSTVAVALLVAASMVF